MPDQHALLSASGAHKETRDAAVRITRLLAVLRARTKKRVMLQCESPGC